jgi:hypothetical protein
MIVRRLLFAVSFSGAAIATAETVGRAGEGVKRGGPRADVYQ